MKANRQFNFICAAAVASALATGFITTTTWAQEVAQATTPAPAAKNSDQIQTVIITANKRSEDANKVALSISVLGGDELVAQHIDDFASATRSIPNFSFSGGGGGGNAGNGPGLSNIQLRGISASGGMSTVGVYLDDVSMAGGNVYSMGSAEPKFFDLDHIEVLRGPQGTLYGASSMGGTIKFISNQPDLKVNEVNVGADISQTAGANGVNHSETVVMNQVLIPGELALRMGVEQAHKAGYIDQTNPAGTAVIANGINWENDQIVRLAMKWAPTKNLTITPQILFQQVETGDIDVSYLSVPPQTLAAYNAGQSGPVLPMNETSKLQREPGKDVIVVPSLTINYGTDIGDITSVTSYFKRNFNRTQDGTTENSQLIAETSVTDPVLAAQLYMMPSQIYLNNEVTQFSQELRITSKPYDPSVSPFTWVAGFYTATMNTNIIENDFIPGSTALFGANAYPGGSLVGAVTEGIPNDNVYFAHRFYTDSQNSVFGEGNYYIVPTFHLTAGVRFLKATDSFSRTAANYWNSDLPDNPFTSVHSTKTTPKFAATWEVSPTDTVYASAAEGFRVGGTNFQLPSSCLLASTPPGYQPDSLWSYEVGDKSRFFNNTLSINADAFYIDWSNIQQLISLRCGFNYSTNVGSAKSSGAEIEIKYKPTGHIVIDFAGGTDHAVLTNNDASNAGVYGAVSGATLPGVPKFNAALSTTYNFALNDNTQGYVRGAAHWTGSSYGGLDPRPAYDPDYQRPAYSNVDLSTGVNFEQYDLSLYVRNVDNNQKIIQHPVVQTTVGEVYRMSPRTIGVTFNGRF